MALRPEKPRCRPPRLLLPGPSRSCCFQTRCWPPLPPDPGTGPSASRDWVPPAPGTGPSASRDWVPPAPRTGPSASLVGVCLDHKSLRRESVCYSSPSPGVGGGEDDLAEERSILSPGLSVCSESIFLFLNYSFHVVLKHLL